MFADHVEGEAAQLQTHDLKALLLESVENAADETALNGVGLEEDERLFHVGSRVGVFWEGGDERAATLLSVSDQLTRRLADPGKIAKLFEGSG